MEADQSIGRVPDGFGEMQVLSVPSPLGSNAGSEIDQVQEDTEPYLDL
jgi:hypothetical protein